MHILILCTGNICRSPYAEHRLKQALSQAGMQGIDVSSAGLVATEGRPSSDATLLLGKDAGLDLSSHRSRQVQEEDLADVALILVMEAEHIRRLKDLAPAFPPERVRLLTEFCPGPRRPAEVPDPHRAERWAHALTYRLIDACVAGVVRSFAQARPSLRPDPSRGPDPSLRPDPSRGPDPSLSPVSGS